MTELTSLTITEALDGMRAGDFSALELTDAHLRRIDALDSHIWAYVNLTPDLAREQALVADALRARGEQRPLLGIPIGIKDVLSTQRR